MLEFIIKFVEKHTVDRRRARSVHDDDQKIQAGALQVDAKDFECHVNQKYY